MDQQFHDVFCDAYRERLMNLSIVVNMVTNEPSSLSLNVLEELEEKTHKLVAASAVSEDTHLVEVSRSLSTYIRTNRRYILKNTNKFMLKLNELNQLISESHYL